METLITIFFFVTPPNLSYHPDGNCTGYEVKTAYAIGGCTQFDTKEDVLKYRAKMKALGSLFKKR